jgi:hypothetical protein
MVPSATVVGAPIALAPPPTEPIELIVSPPAETTVLPV